MHTQYITFLTFLFQKKNGDRNIRGEREKTKKIKQSSSPPSDDSQSDVTTAGPSNPIPLPVTAPSAAVTD